MQIVKKTILLLALVWGTTTGSDIWAQCAAVNNSFQAGESLTYELKFNWKFIWINAGEAYMNIRSTNYNGKEGYKTTLACYTSKKIDRFFKMRDTLTSITTTRLEPLYFRKGAEEGSRYTVDEIKYKYENGNCIVDQLRYRPDRELHTLVEKSKTCVFDMLSILLQARSYNADDYKVGDRILFPMGTGKRIEEQILIYRGKKDFKAEDGALYHCLVFSLVEYVKNKEKEVITFYITDDKNHLPVRLDLYLNFGSAKAFLKTVKGNRYPITARKD